MWPKPNPRIIEVHAYKDDDADHGVRFELRNAVTTGVPPIQPGPPPRLTFNKDVDGMKRIDWHRIAFRLVNHGSLELRFHDDKHQALWARSATHSADCPTEPCKHKHFHPIDREDLELIVRNNNYDPEEIAFTLNFLHPDDDGFDPETFVPCDPIGENQDRGTGISHNNLIGAIVCTASVATVGAAILARRVFADKPAAKRRPKSRGERAK